jgi:hypothetical protein
VPPVVLSVSQLAWDECVTAQVAVFDPVPVTETLAESGTETMLPLATVARLPTGLTARASSAGGSGPGPVILLEQETSRSRPTTVFEKRIAMTTCTEVLGIGRRNITKRP